MKSGEINPYLQKNNSGKDILLTGIPRSGTTLACSLLCNFSQTIALNEPLDGSQFENPVDAVENIKKNFQNFRTTLLSVGTALARTKDGKITDNAYSQNSERRERIVERSKITFKNPLKDDFTLIMKQCAEFTLLLPELANSFMVYAMIRNPLAVMSSWVSVNIPVSRGKVAKSAKLNPDFHNALNDQGENLLKRQLYILSWYFGQYKSFDKSRIFRYEELIESPEKILNTLSKGELLEPIRKLSNKNTSELYNKDQALRIGEALLNSEGNYWSFYSKEEVMQLLQKISIDG
jgi:hypothetical protein